MLDFEDRLWNATKAFQCNLDLSEFKGVVLGLILLKYASGTNTLGKVDWARVEDAAGTPDIGQVIDTELSALEHSNPSLRGVLPKNFSRPELDKTRLGDVVKCLSELDLNSFRETRDILGRTYEYISFKFAEQNGKLAGEFYTPTSVVKTLVEILKPVTGVVYDPSCGCGGMFIEAAKYARAHGGEIQAVGQEINNSTWKIATMNLAVHGVQSKLGNSDTLRNDLYPEIKADYVMANPPFNISDWGLDASDSRWQYGAPPASNANFAWIQHMIAHLSDGGKIGLVLNNGTLSSQSGGEDKIRQKLIEADIVECIISMPDKLFYNTGIPVAIWVLSKAKKQRGKTLFVDAQGMGRLVNRKLRELTDADIRKLADTYNAFVDGTLEDVKGFCAVATTEDIAQHDYILTPGRYVGVEEQEDDDGFEDKMQRLTSELSELFVQSHALETKIKEQLKGIGYAI